MDKSVFFSIMRTVFCQHESYCAHVYKPTVTFHIISIFPEVFEKYLNTSMLWRAKKEKKALYKIWNPRNYTKDKHKKVDHRPYGGGPGMVMTAEPILLAVNKALGRKKIKTKIVIFSPRGKQFTNALAKEWSKKFESLVLIAGHYEGIDARVKKILKAEEVSVGPYVLTGGEIPAMLVADAVTRQLPGVLGNNQSLEEGRIASPEVYTRPETYIYKGKRLKVPKVLLSGHAAKIEEWKTSLTAKRKRL